MKILKLFYFLAVIAICACKKEDDGVPNVLNDADSNFIRLASLSNSGEIEIAKIVVLKTTDSVVLSFAQQMLNDHTRAQSDLRTMGTVVGFTVKDTTLDDAHAATIAQLDSLAGKPFDSTYIHSQLGSHQAAITFYIDEINNGNQLNVRAYANTILPNIRLHYQRADSIATAYY